LVGSVFSYGQHWLPIVTKEGKETNFPKVCLAYDDEIEEKDSEKACPYCDLIDYIQVHYYVNVIVRELEEDVPARIRQTPEEKKTGFKDMNSDSWTPVRVLRLPAGAVAKLNQLSELNLHGPKGKRVSYPLSDEQYGRDVMVMYDKDAAPANQYTFQLGEPTVLEEDYLLWNVENLMVPEELKVAKEQAKRLAALSPDSAEDGEDEEDDYDPPARKPSAKKPARKQVDDDDDFEDEEPVRKPAPKKPASKKPVVDDDDDDDFEDEEPTPKKPAPKRKPAVEEDEDDFEDEEPPARKPAPKKPARRPVGDDEDEDDEEPPARSTAPKKPASKKPVVDDDDDDDDSAPSDDDDDDDE
jgi:hypothetical protein